MDKSKQKTKQSSQSSPEQTGFARQLTGFSSASKVLFIALCCPILLFTVVGMLAPQHATHAVKADLPVFPSISITSIRPTSTTIIFPSPTPTTLPTPTPTQAPTPTPTPIPTPSPTPLPTLTPTQAPTPTPGPRVTPTRQPGPTATPTSSNQIPPFSTPPPNTVATVSGGLSPTPSPDSTTASNNGSGLPAATPSTGLTPGNGNNQNSTVPDNNSNTSTRNPPFLILGSLAAGLLLLVAVAVFLVKKLLEPMMEPVNLPPSGARPWSRTPSPSMNGATDLYGWGNAATGEQVWANDPFAEASPPFMPPNAGFPPVPPAPGYQGNYVVGNPPLTGEDQPSL